LKRIVFLIVASLLLIGLVIPGSVGGANPDIRIAVAGPLNDVQGEHHLWGAEMARDEINVGGVSLDGTTHDIVLVEVDTNEVQGIPEEGIAAIEAVIDGVDFVVGGFRTENVAAYREEVVGPAGAGKIFMNCGAATADLQRSVVTDYEDYKYWFKTTPYNEVFLVQSILKMTGLVGGTLATKTSDLPLRVAIIAENLKWADAMVGLANSTLPLMGMEVVGIWRPSGVAITVSSELTAIKAKDPHIIFTIFSGPVGVPYSKQRADKEVTAMSIGINVAAQQQSFWEATDGGCEHDMILDSVLEGVAMTNTTVAWANKFKTDYGEPPIYTAATYDAVYALADALEVVSAANSWDNIDDCISPANIDKLIQHLESTVRTGAVGVAGYYPMPDINVTGDTWALNLSQVQAIYPDYDPVDYGHGVIPAGPMEGLVYDPMTGYEPLPGQPQWTTTAGYIAHDLIYGPGFSTGVGVQWLKVGA